MFLPGTGLVQVPSLPRGRERHPTSQGSRWTVQGAGGQEDFLEESAFEDGLQYSQVWGSEGEGEALLGVAPCCLQKGPAHGGPGPSLALFLSACGGQQLTSSSRPRLPHL